MHQRLENGVGAWMDSKNDSTSHLIFFDVSIPQIWNMPVTSDDNQIFMFARQPTKLDGTAAPPMDTITFTNYNQPDPDGYVEIVTEFVGCLNVNCDGNDRLSIHSDATSMWLSADLVNDCLTQNCSDMV